MLVLGLDTALQRCSVAILRGDSVLADFGEDRERGHAERIAPMVDEALSAARVAIADIDRIGVVVGPGGFTGVRVALSFARGLGVATGKPVVGVTSLAALAANVSDVVEGALIAPIIDARRGQVYAGLYRETGEIVVAPFVATPEQAFQRLEDEAVGALIVMVGTGSGLMPPAADWSVAKGPAQIDAKVVARLAAAAPAPSGPPRPLYLRPPDAKTSAQPAPPGKRA